MEVTGIGVMVLGALIATAVFRCATTAGSMARPRSIFGAGINAAIFDRPGFRLTSAGMSLNAVLECASWREGLAGRA